MAKPTLPQGTRDFSPEIVRKRNYILNTIQKVFELYGFQPLETPAMENLETLMGKYGDEGDKLIFRILNNGLNDPKNIDKSRTAFENILEGKNDKNLTERALRYDLTIPFARFVAMNQGKLVFPFKRYQIQPVWRADRPQKGRYREFYQCDADVVGSNSLINEVEFVHIYDKVFTQLGLGGYSLQINSRKVLMALAECCGAPDKLTGITIAIDKLDKIGMEKVREELISRGLDTGQTAIIEKYLAISGNNREKLQQVETLTGNSVEGKKGIDELKFILDSLGASQEDTPVQIDFTLARGLNYYTGIIFEAKAPSGVQMGSIGGGGRYDDLTGLFGVPGIPGVGISFGVDRIYDVMEEMKVFPATIDAGTEVMFLHSGDEALTTALPLAEILRGTGVRCELYPEQHKPDKQYKYAEKKNIPYVISRDPAGMDGRIWKIKDIRTGASTLISPDELKKFDFASGLP